MILHELGFSNRQWSVVPHSCEKKPVEHVLGAGLTTDRLTDDGLGRTLDGLCAHDPTTRCAGRARHARRACGVHTQQIHVETTSCSVRGEDASTAGAEAPGTPVMQEADPDPVLIAITSGASRDHREDLTQWMLALATTPDGEIPLVVQPVDGHSSDPVSVCAAIQAIQEHVRAPDEAPGVSVADHRVSSDAHMRTVKLATVTWIRRVSETATDATAALAERDETWHASDDGTMHGISQIMSVPQGNERWVMVSTSASQHRAQASLQRLVTRAHAEWEKTWWHLGHRRCAWETDAQAAMDREEQGTPAWRDIHHPLVAHARHASRGRPRTEDRPRTEEWHSVATVTINQKQVEQEAFRKAWWMGGTTILETTERSDDA